MEVLVSFNIICKAKKRYERVFEKLDDWALDHVHRSIYRIPTRIADFYRSIKWTLQRLFRKSHASDCDIWGLRDHLAEVILPKLVAFKKSYRRGMPIAFMDYEENCDWANKEEYDVDVKKGLIIGGGPEAWEKTIDEMIFAFEYVLVDHGRRYEWEFFKKYPQYNWRAKTKKARHVMRWAHMKDGSIQSLDEFEEPPEGTVKVNSNIIDLGEHASKESSSVYYHDFDLQLEAHERAEAGLQLFAKYFFNLWD